MLGQEYHKYDKVCIYLNIQKKKKLILKDSRLVQKNKSILVNQGYLDREYLRVYNNSMSNEKLIEIINKFNPLMFGQNRLSH